MVFPTSAFFMNFTRMLASIDDDRSYLERVHGENTQSGWRRKGTLKKYMYSPFHI